ncbi:hypothetical protein GWO43_07825 [candidate division KSB1 bacterium]|nr:hypothetical protein [candidate division KSB1 bacterium]NIR72243.1 hypothetical protein [candidate division KSB1 bacterium]NIS23873.1 hypothetical protein [candidate division KSB1 bacterium]NIT70794.1 hypothetical protein [candidate division KSB1 bacterium]NIU24522.1 hypothetical protein [candidate division KSB1 bacterium]
MSHKFYLAERKQAFRVIPTWDGRESACLKPGDSGIKHYRNDGAHSFSFNHCLIVLLILLTPLLVFGQERQLETLLEDQAESSEQSELYEIILNLKENPIDLNTATREQLEILPGLSPSLRHAIIEYRDKHGSFDSIEELQLVPGMDSETFTLIRELVFVSRDRVRQVPRIGFNSRTRVLDRIDRPRGFQDGTYESSPQKLYQRLEFDIANRVHGGVLLEKDSGESRLDDLRMFYLASNLTEQLSVLVGNYHLEIGQGLVLWGPYGFSKSANPIYPIRKRARGVRGYTTVDENAAFFGGSVSFNWGPLQAIAFASKSDLDATPASDGEVSGLFTTGFHRNENEGNKKDVVSESVFGSRVRYTTSIGLSLGATTYRSTFDKIINDPDLERDRFEFRGNENYVVGLDWDWPIRNVILFGEIARSKNGGQALIAGSQLDFDSVQLAFLYRDYQKDFQNLHGFGFGESNGTTQNERGYYTGLDYRITRSTRLKAYFDIFAKPWRSFFQPLPVEGRDFLAQLEQKFGRSIQLTLRFRDKFDFETEDFRDALNREKREFLEKRKSQWRFQFDYRVSPQFRLRSRIEYARFKQTGLTNLDVETKDDGILMYQEIRYQPKPNLQVTGRITFFDTDSFGSSIFQYEHDLPGMVTNRAMFGRGNRWYVLLKYEPFTVTEFSLKYSETFRDDVEVIGTGPNQIEGNLDRRIGVQLEMQF